MSEGNPDRQRLKSSLPFNEDAAKLGKNLANQFCVLMKTAQIHDMSNVAFDQPSENFMKTFEEMVRSGIDISLNLRGDYLYMGETKLKMDIDSFISFTSITEEMKKRGVGGITFKGPSRVGDIKRFISIFASIDTKSESPYESLSKQITKMGLLGVEIEKFEEQKENFEEILEDTKEIAKSTYFKTITAVSEVMENLKLGQSVSIKRAKRVVQSMVDLLLHEESTLLGLTTLRCHDEYTHNHSVNVCIMALTLGQRLGYHKRNLGEIGIASLLHDIGKSEIPLDILNKPSDFSEEEWKIMRRHPIHGVRSIIKLKGLNESAIRVAMGSFEHHLNYDLSGYPKLQRKRDVTLIGRIIGIVDCYDALTSSRVYNRSPFPPEKALRFMLNKSGKAFDPILLKIFINAIGIFPVGTLVLLSTNELGVIVQANPNPEYIDRPKVRLITDRSGNEINGEIIDLTETDPSSGRVTRSIIKTIDALKYKIDVSKYFR